MPRISTRSQATARMLFALFACTAVLAQRTPAKQVTPAATAVLLSDLHFEPYQDPAKFQQLRKSPIDRWPSILNAPASPTKDADFAAVQKACPVRGVDTSWPTLDTSIQQAAAQQPHPSFVTVSGDLLAHTFDCRFKTLTPGSTQADLEAFAAKTVDFVTAQVRHAFPGAPVYLALGNNDTDCADYDEDRNGPFLQHVAQTFADAAGGGEAGKAIVRDFPDQGDYNIGLPAPMQGARLLVLQDIFESPRFKSCAGVPDPHAASDQIDWLRAQLTEARAHHEHAWVMAHMPPGVDMYSTVSSKKDVCTGQPPSMFLSSEALASLLTSFSDVVSLAIFAHSHADELRFLHAPGSTAGVPVKLVSSVSPVNGNRPTFTVAKVDTRTATLLDYTVFFTGEGSAPAKEYSFHETYKLPAFSAPALNSLTEGFLNDTTGTAASSRAYRHYLFPGDTGIHALAVELYWRSYACSLREDTPEGFRTCACPVEPK